MANEPNTQRRMTTEPHQAFMKRLSDAEQEFAGRIPPDERLALTAQFLGQCIAELPDHYEPAGVMNAVAGNLAAGNDMAVKAAKSKKPKLIV